MRFATALLALLIASVVGGIAGGLLARREAPPAVAPRVRTASKLLSKAEGNIAHLEHALRAVRGELRALRSEMAVLRAQQASSRVAATDPSPEKPAAAHSDVPGFEAEAEPDALQAEVDETFDHIQEVKGWESRDHAWAAAIETKGRETLQVPGATIEQLECRSSLCEMRVRFDDEMARETFLGSLAGELGRELPSVRWRHEGNLTTIFLARAGHPMPNPVHEVEGAPSTP